MLKTMAQAASKCGHFFIVFISLKRPKGDIHQFEIRYPDSL
ncbi:hypothetical protein BN1221_04358c [Brenneria goodwinii]|uniref:Uncharacterized protein n=1 Tax=Brenneria goodwinii TaxID=1109412 RepID=A0A0G4K0Z4_9GAMM|nr:hypothetical protein BN1221_04358c [Brenneria goodwinii]